MRRHRIACLLVLLVLWTPLRAARNPMAHPVKTVILLNTMCRIYCHTWTAL